MEFIWNRAGRITLLERAFLKPRGMYETTEPRIPYFYRDDSLHRDMGIGMQRGLVGTFPFAQHMPCLHHLQVQMQHNVRFQRCVLFELLFGPDCVGVDSMPFLVVACFLHRVKFTTNLSKVNCTRCSRWQIHSPNT